MKIDSNQIEEKALAGKTKDGENIVYILTKGGLHAFFAKDDGKIQAIGAAPHKEIARFLAEKKSPGIKWNSEFLIKSECSLEKAESEKFLQFRKLIFWPKEPQAVGSDDIYLIYNTDKVEIEVVHKNDFIKSNYDDYALIRTTALTADPVFIKNFILKQET